MSPLLSCPLYFRDICKKREGASHTRQERLERIREHIVETVAPESWIDRGGRGSVEIVPESSALIVRNTPEVHTMIGGSFSLDDAFDTTPITPITPNKRTERDAPPK